jgi:mono/diheme cytochrome c family protein
MKRLLVVLVLLAIAGLVVFFIVTSPSIMQSAGTEPIPAGEPNVANGKVVFTAGGCESCHAIPKQPDKTRLGGGLGLGSPFGTFYTPNISPHPRDGIGSWTPQQFLRAMRAGVSPEGYHYFPAFPYPAYQRLAAADVRDLFGYLKTLPPVEGKARGHDVPFPFNVRRTLGGWKLLFLDGKQFTPDPSKGASWNRGAYLAEGMAHCAECHSPRNFMGGIVSGMRYAGGPDPEGKGTIPNITSDKETGIGNYTKADMVELLTTGFKPDFDAVGSTMGEVVLNTKQLSQADREAIAEYILSLAPIKNEVRKKKKVAHHPAGSGPPG